MNDRDANQNRPILVLGATGKTGSRVVERLEARGAPVRIGSRSAEPPFDWEDRATWEPALDGVSSAYVSYYPDLAVPGAPEAVWRPRSAGDRERPRAPGAALGAWGGGGAEGGGRAPGVRGSSGR